MEVDSVNSESERQNFRVGKQEFETSNADTNLRTIQSNSGFETTLNRFKNYVPQSDIIDINELRKSKNLKIKKSKYYAYYGEIVDNVRQGKGVMLSGENQVYEGEWMFNLKHGRGFEVFESGNIYEGEYVQGKREGDGIYRWVNGQIYQGQWLNGLKQGTGTWKGPKGDSYVGQWKLGKPQGFGVQVWCNGDRYEGNFKDCLKHGLGYQKYASGDLYKGNFQKGQISGYGEYYWTNGSFYKGDFVKGVRQGSGVWHSNKDGGDIYEGAYVKGKKDGFGVYKWHSGVIYKGNYKQDAREGYGQMHWPNGAYYKGQWKNDCQHGEGETYDPYVGVKRCSFAFNAIVEVLQQEDVQQKIEKKQQLPKKQNRQVIINGQRVFNSRVSRFSTPQKVITPKNGQRKLKASELQRIYKSNNKWDQQSHSSKKQGFRCKDGVANRKMTYIPKREQLQKSASKVKKNTVDFTSKGDSPINQFKVQYRKQHIPHSSFYMHQLHRRVNTSNDESRVQILPFRGKSGQKLGWDQTKPYNLSRLMRLKGTSSSIKY